METVKRDTDHSTGLPPLRVAPAPPDHEEAQLKDELLTVLLHDLRSPIGAVGVLADLIITMLGRGDVPDPQQLKLLQESVAKAQRVLDDAVELQAIIRGSSPFTPSVVDLDLLVDSCIEKARHASYFHKTTIESQIAPDRLFVSVDLEKMETVLLCVLEQLITCAHGSPHILVGASTGQGFVTLHLETSEKGTGQQSRTTSVSHTLHGRLGARRLGESMYSLQICRKVMSQMGGKLEIVSADPLNLEITLPVAAD